MPRTAKTITFSLPPEMAERLDQAMEGQGRSRSEFLRDSMVSYIEECEWQQLLRYGEERGIGPEDVAGLVDEVYPGDPSGLGQFEHASDGVPLRDLSGG